MDAQQVGIQSQPSNGPEQFVVVTFIDLTHTAPPRFSIMRQCEMVCLISWEVKTIGEMLGRRWMRCACDDPPDVIPPSQILLGGGPSH
jgi:hypothetical protein